MVKNMLCRTGLRKKVTLGLVIAGWIAFVLGLLCGSGNVVVSVLLLSVARVLPRVFNSRVGGSERACLPDKQRWLCPTFSEA